MPAKVVEAAFRRWYIARTIILPPRTRTTIMALSDRRQFLKDLLETLAQGAAGAIVLATAATTPAPAQDTGGKDTDIQKRAEDLAGAAGTGGEAVPVNFVNRAFRNGVGGGGAFRNAAGGGLGGGFRNGAFGNGGGGGGAFRNGGFANGGGGGGFRNGAFRNW
jgi:hypothetical protein